MRRQRVRYFFLYLFLLGSSHTLESFAATDDVRLVADLSTDNVSIEANFTGEKILLFGAIDGSIKRGGPDIVIAIRGPANKAIIRRKEKQAGLWINGSAMTLGPVPAFYAVASNKPLEDIASLSVRQNHEIGLDSFLPTSSSTSHDMADFVEAHSRLKQKQGLYAEYPSSVTILSDRLFKSEVRLPSGVPLGDYKIDFFLFENGRLKARQTSSLAVDYVGIEHFLYSMAHGMPLAYGMLGVSLAFIMGWGVATLFRRS